MKKRVIAILVLASLSGSTPPTMALAMQVHIDQPRETARRADAGDHSCCPQNRSHFLVPIFVIPAQPPMPCQDSPCCVKQAPTNSPSMPSTVRLSRPDSGRFSAIVSTSPKQDLRIGTAVQVLDTGPFQLSSIRSIVLRN